MSAKLPLVVYENGERRIVGTAVFDAETGEIQAEVTDSKLVALLMPDLSGYSIGEEAE